MKHPLARILVPFVAVIALRPAAAEKITQKHPDYPVLRLVETRHSAVSQLEESCRQAEKMREAMQLVADLGTPLLPVIDGLASGSLLKSVGKLPGAEGPVEVIESTAGALEVVLGFVAWMNNLGDEYQAPIRGAILASNRLLKSRDSRDVPALLSSYRSACEACVRIEERLSTAQTQLAKAIRLVNLSVVVFDRLGQNSDEIRRSVRELSGQLEKLREIVDLMAGQAEGGHRFMQQVLDAAGPSQAITSGSARVRSTPADHSGSVAAAWRVTFRQRRRNHRPIPALDQLNYRHQSGRHLTRYSHLATRSSHLPLCLGRNAMPLYKPGMSNHCHVAGAIPDPSWSPPLCPA